MVLVVSIPPRSAISNDSFCHPLLFPKFLAFYLVVLPTLVFLRDAKWGSTLELSNTRFNSDMTVPGHANFPPVVTPEVPSPPMHLFSGVISKGNALPGHVCEVSCKLF